MLESYLCKLCRRGCNEVRREDCLKNTTLNLGSGVMLMEHCINFDAMTFKVGDLQTDILGDILEMEHIFKPDTFGGIFCAHVIEHFLPEQARKILADCLKILKPSGRLVLEGPDIAKVVKFFTGEELVQEIYGDPDHIKNYGYGWAHKWGWTLETAAKAMEDAGFTVKLKGDGISHSKTFRDFRVEGFKL